MGSGRGLVLSVTKYLTSHGEPRWRVEWRVPGRRLSPLGWWEFGDGAEVGGDVQAVSVPVLGWAIA